MSLREFYKKSVAPKMQKDFNYKNVNQVPRLVKVVVNASFGKIRKEPKIQDMIEDTLKRVTSQKPVWTKAKKSISAFKIRKGEVIGAVVTLRGHRMFDFLEKLINVTLPRVRDFRGLPLKSLGKGNCLTIGFKENIAFPEIRSDEVERVHGLEVSIVTTAKTKEEGRNLFKYLGLPLQEK